MNEPSGGIFGIIGGIFGGLFSLLVFIFWLWMLIDCIKNEKDGTQRIIWALVIFFVPCVGSLIYYFVRKSPRGK